MTTVHVVAPFATEVHVSSAAGPLFSEEGPGESANPTETWVHDGTVFVLLQPQIVNGNAMLTVVRKLSVRVRSVSRENAKPSAPHQPAH